MDCLFCGIAAGRIEARRLFQDDDVIAFDDIRPVAPTHVLVIPRRHIASLAALSSEDWPVMTRCLQVVVALTERLGLVDGFRVVANTGPDGGQTVDHFHWHLLAGRAMDWPPG
jgi:histidine triad (HIT) family protein